jgi:hypothetical protein
MERAQTNAAPLIHWTERLPGGNLPHAPVWLWVGVAGAILVVYLAVEIVLGDPSSAWRAAPEDDPSRHARVAVLAALTGFIVAASRWSVDGSRRDLEQLSPSLRCSPSEFEAFVRRLYGYNPRGMALCIGGAVLVGLVMIPLTLEGTGRSLASDAWDQHLWFAIALNVALFWVLGRELWATVEGTRVFSELERHLKPVDLLDPRRLAAFAHRGLRSAVFWIGGSCIASLLFLSPGYLPSLGVVGVTVAVGTATFVLPTRTVHRRLRSEKDAELVLVREAIRQERDGLLGSRSAGASESAGARLPGLLAYEARIASASVWPFDAPTVVRFSLLLTLALGSWIGGALVERILSVALE